MQAIISYSELIFIGDWFDFTHSCSNFWFLMLTRALPLLTVPRVITLAFQRKCLGLNAHFVFPFLCSVCSQVLNTHSRLRGCICMTFRLCTSTWHGVVTQEGKCFGGKTAVCIIRSKNIPVETMHREFTVDLQ